MSSNPAIAVNHTPVEVVKLESWFMSEGAGVHEAYGVETHYSTDEARFIPGSEPPVVKLKQLLVAFGRIPAKSQLETLPSDQLDQSQSGSLDLLDCSWKDVLDQLEAAKLENSKCCKKGTKRADRFVAGAAPYIEPWLELVPEEYGLGVIKGGLALLFASAQNKEKNREKIVYTFEEIPEMIRTMDAACKLFGRDGDISGIAHSFYDQLCRDIPVLVQILNGARRGLVRAFNRLAGAVPETKTVDGVLEGLQRKSSELQSVLSRIKMKLQAQSHAEIQAIRAKLQDNNTGIAIISGQLDELPNRRDFEQFTQNNHRHMAQFARVYGMQLIDDIRQGVRVELQALARNHPAEEFAAEAKTMVLMMAQENSVLREHLASQRLQIESNRSKQPSPIPIPALSELDIMQILDVDPQVWTEDLSFVLRQASRMDADSKARARWLMKTRHFQNWLRASHPSLLLRRRRLKAGKNIAHVGSE